jgi:hypothetical protein
VPITPNQQKRAMARGCAAACRLAVHPRVASRPAPAAPVSRISHRDRRVALPATKGGSAARVGGSLLRAWLAALALACALPTPGAPPGPQVFTADPPSRDERYCAWYGSERDGVLYFGEAAFWSGFRAAGGDPRADLALPGPQPLGRFDLRRRALLPSLDVSLPGSRSGVWDVYAHPNGRVYFTTYFEPMGWVDPASGELRHLEQLGTGLNEIAPGPPGEILVSRYGGSRGSVLRISPDGELLAELPLAAPPGYRPAPKTVAYDPSRREIWVTTDLLPGGEGPLRHDTYVLDVDGRELRRIASPEVQFVAFARDGSGARAELEDGRLWLARMRPGAPERRVLLDPEFPVGLDFAQDLQFGDDGGVVVTRWSGAVHRVDSGDRLRTLHLPRLEPDGLYYTAVPADGGICATWCAGVSVVCVPAG